MKIFRNFTPTVLGIIVIYFLFPLCTSAQKRGKTADGFGYVVSDNAVTITVWNGQSSHVVIPDTINGFPVKVIGAQAFVGKKRVQSIVLPSGLTTIRLSAFFNLPITSIEIPSDVDIIGGGSLSYNFPILYKNQERKAGKYTYQNGRWYLGENQLGENQPPSEANLLNEGSFSLEFVTAVGDLPGGFTRVEFKYTLDENIATINLMQLGRDGEFVVGNRKYRATGTVLPAQEEWEKREGIVGFTVQLPNNIRIETVRFVFRNKVYPLKK